jgi:hypothetical protein
MFNNKNTNKDLHSMLLLVTKQNEELLTALSLMNAQITFLADRQRKEDLVIRKVL